MSENVRNFVNWLAILGIPSIFAMTSWCIKKCMQYTNQLKILITSQQAQMRSMLLKDYYTYMQRGFVYESELADWENQYQSYHSLGKNGVMDSKRDKLMKLETRLDIQ